MLREVNREKERRYMGQESHLTASQNCSLGSLVSDQSGTIV